MNRARLYVASGIFLGATFLRLLFPALYTAASDALNAFWGANDRSYDYVTAIGRLFAPAAAEQQAHLVITETHYGSRAVAETAENGASAEAMARAAETFRESQTEFADLTVPANVSEALYTLPFPFVSPIAGIASSGFGYRIHPIYGGARFHYGTDFAADAGENVLCFADGTVTAAAWDDGYGYYVAVEHADGYSTLYAHCSRLLVDVGEKVARGELLAAVGSTGSATGPHLHFELRHDGIYLNPEFCLALL